MLSEFDQKLIITVRSGPTPDHDEISATIRSEMKDCDVHAWFDLFEKVLAMAGFQEVSIMQGACKLAFNECRPADLMRRVAHDFDLTLNEHLPDYPFNGPATAPSDAHSVVVPLRDA